MTRVLDVNALRFDVVSDARHAQPAAARPAAKDEESKDRVPAHDLDLQHVLAQSVEVRPVREVCVVSVESQVHDCVSIENAVRAQNDAAHRDAGLLNDESLRRVDAFPPVASAPPWRGFGSA